MQVKDIRLLRLLELDMGELSSGNVAIYHEEDVSCEAEQGCLQ